MLAGLILHASLYQRIVCLLGGHTMSICLCPQLSYGSTAAATAAATDPCVAPAGVWCFMIECMFTFRTHLVQVFEHTAPRQHSLLVDLCPWLPDASADQPSLGRNRLARFVVLRAPTPHIVWFPCVSSCRGPDPFSSAFSVLAPTVCGPLRSLLAAAPVPSVLDR